MAKQAFRCDTFQNRENSLNHWILVGDLYDDRDVNVRFELVELREEEEKKNDVWPKVWIENLNKNALNFAQWTLDNMNMKRRASTVWSARKKE